MTKLEFSKEDLESGAEEALSKADSAGGSAVALVEAWVKANNADAVQEIAEHGAGAARKAARRGLNVLKSRGVAIPPRRKLTAREVAAPATEATMISPDGSGTTLFVISRTHASGRCVACFAYLNDATGVQRVERADTTAGRIKSLLNRGFPGSSGKPVPVPVPWARQRIAEARKLHLGSKVPEPLGFDSSKDLLEPLPEAPVEHPFDTEGFEFSEEDAKERARESGALHHLPEFAGWFPPRSALNELLLGVGKRISANKKGDAEPPQEEVAEHIKSEMLEQTDRYFGERERTQLVRRMKDAALSVLARKGEGEALQVAATIQAVQQCGTPENPARDVPFLRAFFEKLVSLMMMQQGGQLTIPIPKAPAKDAEASKDVAATEAAANI